MYHLKLYLSLFKWWYWLFKILKGIAIAICRRKKVRLIFSPYHAALSAGITKIRPSTIQHPQQTTSPVSNCKTSYKHLFTHQGVLVYWRRVSHTQFVYNSNTNGAKSESVSAQYGAPYNLYPEQEVNVLCVFWPDNCTLPLFVLSLGEGVVSEQTDEVEEGEGWTAGGSGEGEGIGECEKGDFAAFRVFGHCRTAPHGGLSGQWRQSWQWPKLWACSVMIQRGPWDADWGPHWALVPQWWRLVFMEESLEESSHRPKDDCFPYIFSQELSCKDCR